MADGTSAQQGLPSSNRGVSEFRKQSEVFRVLLDWFSASVDLPATLNETAFIGSMKETLDTLDQTGANACTVAQHVVAFYFGGSGFEVDQEARPGRFYAWRVGIKDADGNHVGLIEMGGPHTVRKDGAYTCRLELTGQGCRLYEGAAGCDHARARWLQLRAKLESCAGRLTRIDIAADDLQGQFPIAWAIDAYKNGEFNNRGQTPVCQHIDHKGGKQGDTFYVGSKTSERRLRVYEKGRELGDQESPWVRYEAEFKASLRKELPLDMLRDPAAYMLGAYPVLRLLNAIARRIDVTQASAVSTLKSARRHIKRQYGATLAFIVKHTHDDAQIAYVIRSLTSPKLPAWAANEEAKNWPEILAITSKGNNHEQQY